MASDWREAQGLKEYDAYQDAIQRQLLREEAQQLRDSPDGVAYEMVVGKFEDRRLTQEHLEDGWLPVPRYIGRAEAQRLSGAESLFDAHGQLMGYRFPEPPC